MEPVRGYGIWLDVNHYLPKDERKVLCCTETKKGGRNLVIGYYHQGLQQWACGMNSNVVAWMDLPPKELPWEV